MSSNFATLGLSTPIVDALHRNGITEPFPVQAATIPDVLAGRDVSGRAPTGSGKTLAFGLPMLDRVAVAKSRRPTALVLTPTRELAAQIRKDLAPYGKATGRQVFAIFGGVRYQAQKDWLDRGVDILVATPGRLEDLIDQKAVDLREVAIVAVDEADRMADMGFLPAVRRILDQTSPDRQTLLFSATLDGDVAVLIRAYQKDPVRHEAGSIEPDVSEAEHFFWDVEREEKVSHVADVINATGSTIVFTRTRHGADRLAKQLAGEGVAAVAMHGGRSQNQRNRALADFSVGRVAALVATDVAARGIHVDDVATVIHYDPPNGHKDYLHRSGRTARAGASGTIVSLVTSGERRAVTRMQRDLQIESPIRKPHSASLSNRGVIGSSTSRHAVGRPVDLGPERTTNPPASTRSGQARRGQARSAQAKAGQARSGQARSGQDRPTRRPERSNGTSRGTGVFVSNLPWTTTDKEIHSLFARFGTVHDARITMDRRGRSKGVAIVHMDDSAARLAVSALARRKVDGRPIEVRLAR
ncbi:MAG TPA: DEAD/DEAH box helicase [Acidimicrobiia bacterium]|nr:DEAD/DEAH box helicase [Acidimicrobiia bacterium]